MRINVRRLHHIYNEIKITAYSCSSQQVDSGTLSSKVSHPSFNEKTSSWYWVRIPAFEASLDSPDFPMSSYCSAISSCQQRHGWLRIPRRYTYSTWANAVILLSRHVRTCKSCEHRADAAETRSERISAVRKKPSNMSWAYWWWNQSSETVKGVWTSYSLYTFG